MRATSHMPAITKAQAVDPGDGRELQQRETAARGIAGKIPRKADDRKMRPRQTRASPKETAPARMRGDLPFLRGQRHAHRKDRGQMIPPAMPNSPRIPRRQSTDRRCRTAASPCPSTAGRSDKKRNREEIRRAELRAGGAPQQASTSMPDRNPGQQRQIVIGKREAEATPLAEGEQDSR